MMLMSLPEKYHHLLFQSLKKEIDWDRGDDKSTSDAMEYRHSHDSVSLKFFKCCILKT